SWREAMYAAAEGLTPDDLHAISKFCFLEMARAGITAVGEFHYLHRDASGKPYANPNELDLAVASAAQDAGLRVVLWRVAYARKWSKARRSTAPRPLSCSSAWARSARARRPCTACT